MSEELSSEGEKGDLACEISSHGGERMARIGSVDNMDKWASRQKDYKLYLILIRYPATPIFTLFSTIFSKTFETTNSFVLTSMLQKIHL